MDTVSIRPFLVLAHGNVNRRPKCQRNYALGCGYNGRPAAGTCPRWPGVCGAQPGL